MKIPDEIKSTNEYVAFLSGTNDCELWSTSCEYNDIQRTFLAAVLDRDDRIFEMAPLLVAIAVNPQIHLSCRAAIAHFITSLLIAGYDQRTTAAPSSFATLTDALTSVLKDLVYDWTEWCQKAYKFLVLLIPAYVPPHSEYAKIWKIGLLTGIPAIQADLLKWLYFGCQDHKDRNTFTAFCHDNKEIWTLMASKGSITEPVIAGAMKILLMLLSASETDDFVVHDRVYGQIFHKGRNIRILAAKFWHLFDETEMWPKLLNFACKIQV